MSNGTGSNGPVYNPPTGPGPLPNNTDPANGNINSPINGTKFTHLQTEYQVFPEEFFSGSDVTIYFGDIFVDTVTGLEFSLQENVRPLYGYADYAWGDVARGTRIVQGTFRIAFKEAGYLFVILDHLAQLGNQAQPALGYLMTNQKVPDWHASARQTIEDTLDYYHGDSGRERSVYKDYTTNETVFFDWPTMAIGASDSNAPYSNSKQAKAAGYKGAVAHLQSLLIANGYTIPWATEASKLSGLRQRYIDGDKWLQSGSGRKTLRIHLPSGKDFDVRTYGVNGDFPNGGRPSRPLKQGDDRYDSLEAMLQKRLYYYSFLKDQNIKMSNSGDGSDVDGKYGDLVRHAVALFQMFGEHIPKPMWGTDSYGFTNANYKNNNTHAEPSGEVEWIATDGVKGHAEGWGGYVDQYTAAMLQLGIDAAHGPRGFYDVATKGAVYNFQKAHKGEYVAGPDGKKYGPITPTGNCDSATVWLMSKLWNQKQKQHHELAGTEKISRAGTKTQPEGSYWNRVKQYEREIWGRYISADSDHKRRSFFYDGGTYTAGQMPIMPRLKKTGFDIYITYGPIGIWALQNVKSGSPDTYQGAIPNQEKAPFPNTVHAIRNVQLASIGQVINASGDPIEEVYAFMARDLD